VLQIVFWATSLFALAVGSWHWALLDTMSTTATIFAKAAIIHSYGLALASLAYVLGVRSEYWRMPIAGIAFILTVWTVFVLFQAGLPSLGYIGDIVRQIQNNNKLILFVVATSSSFFLTYAVSMRLSQKK
jgi:hypothetical protein